MIVSIRHAVLILCLVLAKQDCCVCVLHEHKRNVLYMMVTSITLCSVMWSAAHKCVAPHLQRYQFKYFFMYVDILLTSECLFCNKIFKLFSSLLAICIHAMRIMTVIWKNRWSKHNECDCPCILTYVSVNREFHISTNSQRECRVYSFHSQCDVQNNECRDTMLVSTVII